MRISDWSSDVCSSDLLAARPGAAHHGRAPARPLGPPCRRDKGSEDITMNVIEQIEKDQIDKLTAGRPVPRFKPGDTLRVKVKVVEGTRERVQAFEGVCIARKNAGLNSNFTVRKISYGEGVERVFPLYSPRIEEIEVVRRGAVRRAKLYYLRSEEHTSELQSLMRISYAVFRLRKTTNPDAVN